MIHEVKTIRKALEEMRLDRASHTYRLQMLSLILEWFLIQQGIDLDKDMRKGK